MSNASDWPTVKLGEVVEINPRLQTRPADDDNITFIPMTAVEEAGFISSKELRTYGEVKKGYTPFQKDDLLLAKITPCFQNKKISAADIDTEVGIGSTEFHVLRTSNAIDMKYLLHLLRQDSVVSEGEKCMTGSGGQRRVPRWFLENLSIPLPPLAEQQRIAEILSQVENMRKLHEEQDQLLSSRLGRSLISELASLNAPSVKLADISTISSGSTPSRKKSGYYGGSIPWVKTNEVNGREIFDTEEKLTELGLKESSCKIYPAGTVLIAMYGQGATRGQAGLLGVRAATNQACASVVPHDLEDSEFIFEALKANYEQLRSLGRGGTQPNLNLSLVKDFQIPYPSKEQRQEFRERIAAVHKIKLMNAERLAKLTEVSQALKTRAFAGQL